MNKKVIGITAAIIFVIAVAAMFSKGKSPVSSSSVVKETVQAEPEAKDLYEKAKRLQEKGDVLQAKALYKKIIENYPDFGEIEDVQKRLENVNMAILFSKRQTPQTIIHVVEPGDSLGKLAKKYHTTIELIKKSNGLISDVIRVGQRLRIWTGTFSVLVDKSQNKLILKSNGEVMKVYDVSTGKDNSTPVGTFTIVNKLVDPVWYKSGAIVPPESPKNELGTRWLGFDIPGYGIHGTSDPNSIGMQITAGCVRMRNKDVEELYSILPIGTKVTIID